MVVEIPRAQGVRTPDVTVDGIRTEFKTMSPGGTSATVRSEVSNSLKNGGQARNIIIDARGSGLTEAEANRGLDRVAGFQGGN